MVLVERYAWKARLLEGKKEEYIKRHDEIWDDMKDMLIEAGIQNYSIWLTGNELFGYYECTNGITHAAKTQVNSEVVGRWNEYMKDIMVMEKDPVTGAQLKLEQVFMFPME